MPENRSVVSELPSSVVHGSLFVADEAAEDEAQGVVPDGARQRRARCFSRGSAADFQLNSATDHARRSLASTAEGEGEDSGACSSSASDAAAAAASGEEEKEEKEEKEETEEEKDEEEAAAAAAAAAGGAAGQEREGAEAGGGE